MNLYQCLTYLFISFSVCWSLTTGLMSYHSFKDYQIKLAQIKYKIEQYQKQFQENQIKEQQLLAFFEQYPEAVERLKKPIHFYKWQKLIAQYIDSQHLTLVKINQLNLLKSGSEKSIIQLHVLGTLTQLSAFLNNPFFRYQTLWIASLLLKESPIPSLNLTLEALT